MCSGNGAFAPPPPPKQMPLLSVLHQPPPRHFTPRLDFLFFLIPHRAGRVGRGLQIGARHVFGLVVRFGGCGFKVTSAGGVAASRAALTDARLFVYAYNRCHLFCLYTGLRRRRVMHSSFSVCVCVCA